jgi:hypothetical protein
LNNQPNNSSCEAVAEEVERSENNPHAPRLKKPFVEPVVSVPIDVLEATAYFLQQPTITGTPTT